MAEPHAALKVEGLAAIRGGSTVVRDFSIDIRPEEVVALLGPNGAGKSTVIDAITGFAKKSAGSIFFFGEDITGLAPYHIVKRGLIQVSQERDLFPEMSVLENLLMGLEARPGRGRQNEEMDELLQIFPVLKDRMNQMAGSLSGGEQQMLAIARALVGKPKVLLLDEPSSGLAPLIVQQIGEFLQALSSSGLTILLVEQNVNIALQLCTRFVVLKNGTTAFAGDRADLGDSPREFLAKLYI